jgi:hypothetical protein
VFVSLLLRPIVKFINRQPLASSELEIGYLVAITCRSPDEAHIRALLLQSLVSTGLALRRLDSNDLNGSGHRLRFGDRRSTSGYECREDRRAIKPGADCVRCAGKICGLHAVSRLILFAIYDLDTYFVSKFYHPMFILSPETISAAPARWVRVPHTIGRFLDVRGYYGNRHGISAVVSANYRVRVVRLVWPPVMKVFEIGPGARVIRDTNGCMSRA